MRTSYHSVSSARRLSSWLMALLGLAAYVGLIYVLTLVPLQFEVPLPKWAVASIPPVTYGLLVWLWVRRPSVVRWLVGTAVLSGLHVLLSMSREPLSALLDPALAGRALPWMLPPPLPELIGVMLLLVPLRDLLHAPARLPRERSAVTARPPASLRARAATPARVHDRVRARGERLPERGAALAERAGSRARCDRRSGGRRLRRHRPRRYRTRSPVGAAPPRREAPARRRSRPARPADRKWCCGSRSTASWPSSLPAPFSRRRTRWRRASATPASCGSRASSWSPSSRKVWHGSRGAISPISSRRTWSGLSKAEIAEHLGDGLRLPLDEVISQFPQELFVADTPEVEIHGLHRIPVPFHPVEESDTATEPAPAIQRDPEITPAPEIRSTPPVEAPRVPTPLPPARAVVDGDAARGAAESGRDRAARRVRSRSSRRCPLRRCGPEPAPRDLIHRRARDRRAHRAHLLEPRGGGAARGRVQRPAGPGGGADAAARLAADPAVGGAASARGGLDPGGLGRGRAAVPP